MSSGNGSALPNDPATTGESELKGKGKATQPEQPVDHAMDEDEDDEDDEEVSD